MKLSVTGSENVDYHGILPTLFGLEDARRHRLSHQRTVSMNIVHLRMSSTHALKMVELLSLFLPIFSVDSNKKTKVLVKPTYVVVMLIVVMEPRHCFLSKSFKKRQIFACVVSISAKRRPTKVHATEWLQPLRQLYVLMSTSTMITTQVENLLSPQSQFHISVFACEMSRNTVIQPKVEWEGITRYNNVLFELEAAQIKSSRSTTINEQPDMVVTTWRAFDIGPGKKIRWSKLNTILSIDSCKVVFSHTNDSWKSDGIIKYRSGNLCHHLLENAIAN